MKAQAKYYELDHERLVLTTLGVVKGSGEPALSKKRDIDESSGQKLYLKRMFKE